MESLVNKTRFGKGILWINRDHDHKCTSLSGLFDP